MSIFGRCCVVRGFVVALMAIVLGAWCTPGRAQATAHYVPGVEGIKAATLPPPGLYLRDYNVAYFSDRLNDRHGHEIDAADFHSSVYAQVPRLLWITDAKILGGNLGLDVLGVGAYQDVHVNTPGGPFDSHTFSAGDPMTELTLSWHGAQWDVAAGIAEWIPAGPSHAPPTTKAGLGYFGTMSTLGGTWYPDPEKTWALSLLSRYEFNCQDRDTHVQSGDALTLEWGASKNLFKVLDLGIVGYYQQQITPDRGSGASRAFDNVVGIGPEANLVIPDIKTIISLRYVYELYSENRAQGSTLALTLTYCF